MKELGMSMEGMLERICTVRVMRAQLNMHEDTEINQEFLPSRRS